MLMICYLCSCTSFGKPSKIKISYLFMAKIKNLKHDPFETIQNT